MIILEIYTKEFYLLLLSFPAERRVWCEASLSLSLSRAREREREREEKKEQNRATAQ
jgi:hypothetical protein